MHPPSSIRGAPPGCRLGYCTNVHPYADLPGLLAALEQHAAPLRARLLASGVLAPGAPLGVGLWFPSEVARAVADDSRPLAALLARLHLEAFTVNAFPAGAFHGPRVKSQVFRPAWTEPERLDYTLVAARALAALLPAGGSGSLSTHTGGWKAWGLQPARIADGLLAAAEGLATLERQTGRHLRLALEPEPLSSLETTDEVCAFFAEHLLPAGAAARRHLALCYDACHQAVEFEDMAASLAQLASAGVNIAKLQLSSAIRLLQPGQPGARALLAPFAEDRWSHQVVARAADGSLQRLLDLPEALVDARAAAAGEWRIHYHVPIFAERLDEQGALLTTRPQLELLLRQALADAARDGSALDLEIETYTWHALPPARRAALGLHDVVDCLEQEFRWVAGNFRIP